MSESRFQDGGSTFPLFPKLPPELRDKIWQHALDRGAELALYRYREGCWRPRWLSASDEGFDPVRTDYNLVFEFGYDQLDEARMDVPIAFANSEAQGNAISWAQHRYPLVRTFTDRHVPVFLRVFDPDRDALYVSPDQFDTLLQEPLTRGFAPDMVGRSTDIRPNIVRMAIPESLVQLVATPFVEDSEVLHAPSGLLELFDYYYDLRTLYIVMGKPPDFSLPLTSNLTTGQKFRGCEKSHKVAVWIDGRWEFDFTQGEYSGEFQSLVKLAGQELGKGLVGMSIREFEIHAVSVARN
ncbi:hypothetical protein GGR52DRAFT_564394 [Hypoxylon sp. FL1284]|nr:hypothetical protein GGR52DRAFT_564394 [Hypoxylon sp. FL1284]